MGISSRDIPETPPNRISVFYRLFHILTELHIIPFSLFSATYFIYRDKKIRGEKE